MLDKFLEKIPIDKVYEDLLQPGLKKTGEALATVIGLGNTILIPIRLLNETVNIRLKAHLERLEKKLEVVDERELIPAQGSIAIPIIEKLLYLDEEHLSEIFLNLLTKASSTRTLGLVHPAFMNVVNNISADEAKILFHYKDNKRIQFIDFYIIRFKENIPKPNHLGLHNPKTREQLNEVVDYSFQDKEETEFKAAWNLTGIEVFTSIDFPENVDVYIENLERLGIIAFERNLYSNLDTDLEIYNKLENEIYMPKISALTEPYLGIHSDSSKPYKYRFQIKKGYIFFTEFGKLFIKSCLKEIEKA